MYDDNVSITLILNFNFQNRIFLKIKVIVSQKYRFLNIILIIKHFYKERTQNITHYYDITNNLFSICLKREIKQKKN